MPRHAPRPAERLAVASPCNAEWDAMEGNERVRFCHHCSLHVRDVSRMTPAQAFDLVLRSEGRLCLRLHRRPDGSLVTREPAPPPLYQIRRRVSRLAAGAFGAALTLCTAAAAEAQTAQTANPPVAEQNHRASGSGLGSGVLTGTLTDSAGAVVANATVMLINEATGENLRVNTNDEGVYRFEGLDAGAYTLRMLSPGFKMEERQGVAVSSRGEQTADATLSVGEVLSGDIVIVEPSEPLVKAALTNDLPALKELLASGADVNVVDQNLGATALALAVANGNREMVVELLRAGASVNARLAYRQTALMRLSPNTTAEVVRELLFAGAKVNLRDEDGSTALMAAAAWGTPEIVEMLLKEGARVNARTKTGETPLMHAARNGATENVRALVGAGADLDRRNGEGETALRLARDNGQEETADLLAAYGAADGGPKEEEEQPPPAETAPQP